ncbi:MAG: hypothetical protein SNF68_08775 [Rikenellaceae bacterium]
MAETNTQSKMMSGYRIATVILAAVLVVLSILYFNIHSKQQAEYLALSGERDAIKENLTELVGKFEKLETTNGELQKTLEAERNRTDSIIAKLTKEKNLNYSKLKQYEREVASLRNVIRGYLEQIDSLNNLNQELMSENVGIKKQLTSTELRAEEAEELARRLQDKVNQGELLVANGIEIVSLNKRGREISRIKRAAQISINFTIAANKLAKAGNTEIIACVTSPDGYVLTTEALPTFNLNGKKTTYTASRKVDFRNTDLPVSIFFTGEKLVGGVYEVVLYNNGAVIGSSKLEVR